MKTAELYFLKISAPDNTCRGAFDCTGETMVDVERVRGETFRFFTFLRCLSGWRHPLNRHKAMNKKYTCFMVIGFRISDD